MTLRNLLLAAAAAVTLGFQAAQPALAIEDDPGPAAYEKAMKGKRVVLVPLSMGFDLAQGWAAILKRELDAVGGILETRDPNWSTEAGAQAITDVINSDTKPDVLIIMSPDLNSYSKLMKKAQDKGIYVILVDNPANYKADAYVGGDWDKLGQLEAEAAIKGCGDKSSKKIGLVQGDQVNATSLYQYAGIMKVLDKHPDFKVVAKPDSNWDATTSRNVTVTMLQQNPDICAIIDFWDGDASGSSSAIRDAGKQDQIFLVTTGGGEETATCANVANGTYDAVVSTELYNESEALVATIKYLLQSGQPPGTASPYLYTLMSTVTKDNLNPRSCWNLKALQAAAGQ